MPAEVSVKLRKTYTNLNLKKPQPKIEIKKPLLAIREENLLACSFGEGREEGLFHFLFLLNVCVTYL